MGCIRIGNLPFAACNCTLNRKILKTFGSILASHDWLQQTRLHTAPNSATAKAIDYSLKRWAALTRYAQTGDLPIDNNPIENQYQADCLGQKELAVRRLGTRRKAGRRDPNPARYRQAQRP